MGGNQIRTWKPMLTAPEISLNSGHWSCEAAALFTALLCCPSFSFSDISVLIHHLLTLFKCSSLGSQQHLFHFLHNHAHSFFSHPEQGWRFPCLHVTPHRLHIQYIHFCNLNATPSPGISPLHSSFRIQNTFLFRVLVIAEIEWKLWTTKGM